jgi:hypothetical protein
MLGRIFLEGSRGNAAYSILRTRMRPINQGNAKGGLLAVAAVLIIIISWGILFGRVLAANVTASWSYDFGPMPACSETRTIDCVDHFEVLDITDPNKTVMIQSVSNPKPAVGKVNKVSTDFKYGPPFGQRTISVIAVGRDRDGVRRASSPYAARVTVSIPPRVKMSLVF